MTVLYDNHSPLYLPPSLPRSAGTKRHLSYVDGEEKSQHFVQRTPRSGFTKSLTGGRAVFTHSLKSCEVL